MGRGFRGFSPSVGVVKPEKRGLGRVLRRGSRVRSPQPRYPGHHTPRYGGSGFLLHVSNGSAGRADARSAVSPVAWVMEGCFLPGMEKSILNQRCCAGRCSDGFYSTTWLFFLTWLVGFVLNSSFAS